MCRGAGYGGGVAWSDGSSDGGSDGAAIGEDRFLESLMSLRRSAKSFGLDTAGTDFPDETPQHVRLSPLHPSAPLPTPASFVLLLRLVVQGVGGLPRMSYQGH